MRSEKKGASAVRWRLRLLLTAATCSLYACGDAGELPLQHSLLLSEGWILQYGEEKLPVPATVPGTVHTDMLAAGLINDPFAPGAEKELQWIENEDWVYQCRFDCPKGHLAAAHSELHFEGIDTYGTVVLNGHELLATDNMFRSWTLPVSGLLRARDNELEVRLASPVKRHRGAADSLGFCYPSDNDTSHTSPFVRKAAYHFGWDWAPRFVTAGIWKPVFLKSFSIAAIRDVWIEQLSLGDHRAQLRAHVEVEVMAEGHTLELQVNGHLWSGQLEIGGHTVDIDFDIDEPQRWWPNGMGDAHLYTIETTLRSRGEVVDSHECKLGLRTIELVNAPDSAGTSFFFAVNGKPVFAKGANYVPQDVFLPRVTDAQYRNLLTAAREAHMNMVRVWGGGVYERDMFYALCDSLGIMVWHDFMFAGTTYPGDSLFAESVKAEATQEVKRLRGHPCLALWCGNNEVEVAWHNWGWQKKYGYTPSDSALIWRDYQRIFEEVLPATVYRYHPGVAYIPTTPQSNWGNPEGLGHGAMHYWGVWHGREPLTAFAENVGRFMVEYGMQSYPDLATLRGWLAEEDLELESEAMTERQKSYIGNKEIWRHIADLGMKPADFEAFVEAGHAVQAEALKMAIESHRSSGGHCMGSLLWQLNDCWPGASWSIVDYRGVKKPAYRAVKAAFSDEPGF